MLAPDAGSFRLADLVAGQPGWRFSGDGGVSISDVQFDSRNVGPGVLFVALRGGYADGHDFAEEAVRQGATAIMVEHELPLAVPQIVVENSRRELARLAARFFSEPSHEVRVTGITGTDGKTTTSYILDHILRGAGRTTGMIGTVAIRIGSELAAHESRQTTPESLDVQRLLRQMVTAGVTDAILEATSHGLDLHRLDDTRFVAAAVTNITQEHLEYHQTIEAYWRAKARLFERVSETGGLAVVNTDDAGARSVLPYCGGCSQVIRYSTMGAEAELSATIEREGIEGSVVQVSWERGSERIAIPLVGSFNVANSMTALGLAVGLGVPFDQALSALGTVPAIPGRMTSVVAGQPFGVVVDYAHTPESLEKVLVLLRALRPSGRLIAVFGSAGERDAVKRPIQGRVAAKLADQVIITNEDPRFEDAESIVREIAVGAMTAGRQAGVDLHLIVERREAIRKALGLAEPGDTVLLAGKGHEQSIIWNGEKLPWDEASVARQELADLGWSS